MFNEQEKTIIFQILSQQKFAPGQSEVMKAVEGILGKIQAEQKQAKEDDVKVVEDEKSNSSKK